MPTEDPFGEKLFTKAHLDRKESGGKLKEKKVLPPALPLGISEDPFGERQFYQTFRTKHEPIRTLETTVNNETIKATMERFNQK